MNRKDIISGAIMEVSLEKSYGFGYVKLVFAEDLLLSRSDTVIVKPYNIFRKESLRKEDFIKSDFETDDLTLYPLLMLGHPRIRGEQKWVLKGYADLTEEDKIIPDYLNIGMHEKFNLTTILISTKGKYGCPVVRNLANKRIYTNDFEAIKHLGQWVHSSLRAIRTHLTMHWMSRNGDSPASIYTHEEFQEDYWLGFELNRVKHNQIDFTQVKRENRMKAQI